MPISIIIFFVVAGVASAAVVFFALSKSRSKIADYSAFAQDNGWDLRKEDLSGGAGSQTVFSDPNDNWELRLIFVAGRQGEHSTSSSFKRRVEWHCPDGALADGTAVLGAPLRAKAVAILGAGGAMAQAVLKAGTKLTVMALGNTARDLPLDEASAGHPGGIVFASAGNTAAMDILRNAEALAAVRAGKNEADQPIIIRDTSGLTLRMRMIKGPEQFQELVSLGKALRETLA
jgi:hypothetical protein